MADFDTVFEAIVVFFGASTSGSTAAGGFVLVDFFAVAALLVAFCVFVAGAAFLGGSLFFVASIVVSGSVAVATFDAAGFRPRLGSESAQGRVVIWACSPAHAL